MNIDKAIKILEEVKRVQTLQEEQGVNSIRKEMISNLLFQVKRNVGYELEIITNQSNDFSPEYLHDMFYADYDSGELYKRSTKEKVHLSPTKRGYLRLGIGKRKMFVHRIIYTMYHNRPIPNDLVIDHIDGNKINNSINNLRLCKHEENVKNCGIHAHNTSGYKNIFRRDNKDSGHYRNKPWVVQIRSGGKRHIKYCRTLDEAIEHRDRMLVKLHGEFANNGETGKRAINKEEKND